MEMYALNHKVDSIFTVYTHEPTLCKNWDTYTHLLEMFNTVSQSSFILWNRESNNSYSLQSSGGMCLIISPHSLW